MSRSSVENDKVERRRNRNLFSATFNVRKQNDTGEQGNWLGKC